MWLLFEHKVWCPELIRNEQVEWLLAIDLGLVLTGGSLCGAVSAYCWLSKSQMTVIQHGDT